MKLLILILALFSLSVAADSTLNAETENDGVRLEKRNRLTSLRSKNHGYFTVPLRRNTKDGLYYLPLNIGAFRKRLNVLFDTSMTDMIIPATYAAVPTATRFQPLMSPTYLMINNFFNILYPDVASGSQISGEWGTDTINLNGNVVGNVKMPLDLSGRLRHGVMGLGNRLTSEPVGAGNRGAVYESLLQSIKKQGYIRKMFYSFNFGEANTGILIFGGYDKHGFTGSLHFMNMFPLSSGANKAIKNKAQMGSSLPPTDNLYSNLFVTLNSITHQSNTLTPQSYPVTIVTRSEFITVPEAVFAKLGARYSKLVPELDAYEVDCKSTGQDFEFDFSGKRITVRYKTLVLKFSNVNGHERCVLGIKRSQNPFVTLGTSFLKNAYVAYDLDDNKLGLAQSKYTYIHSIVAAT